MVLAQKQTVDEWNRTENSEIDPQLYGQLIFNKAEKNIQWKKDSLFNIWYQENCTATCSGTKLDHFLIPHKNRLKIDERLTCETGSIKILEENIGSNLCGLGHSHFLLDTSPKARETKAK